MMKQRTEKILVGYSLRLREDAARLLPKGLPEAADDLAELAGQPHTGTVARLKVCAIGAENAVEWSYRDPASGRPPLAVAVRGWLLKTYAQALAPDGPGLCFIGFAPQVLLRVLALECSRPAHGKPLPWRVWAGPDGHVDLTQLLLHGTAGEFSLREVLRDRAPEPEIHRMAWDKLLTDWPGPGRDPAADLQIVAELAAQLGAYDA